MWGFFGFKARLSGRQSAKRLRSTQSTQDHFFDAGIARSEQRCAGDGTGERQRISRRA
jgi:hypothetical protein